MRTQLWVCMDAGRGGPERTAKVRTAVDSERAVVRVVGLSGLDKVKLAWALKADIPSACYEPLADLGVLVLKKDRR